MTEGSRLSGAAGWQQRRREGRRSTATRDGQGRGQDAFLCPKHALPPQSFPQGLGEEPVRPGLIFKRQGVKQEKSEENILKIEIKIGRRIRQTADSGGKEREEDGLPLLPHRFLLAASSSLHQSSSKRGSCVLGPRAPASESSQCKADRLCGPQGRATVCLFLARSLRRPHRTEVATSSQRPVLAGSGLLLAEECLARGTEVPQRGGGWVAFSLCDHFQPRRVLPPGC